MSSITENKQGMKVLITGSILQLFLGIIYVWSVFKAPVSVFYGWAVTETGLTASFMLCFFVIGIFAGGKVQTKIGVKLTVLIGGLMVAAGMLATALIPTGGARLSSLSIFSTALSAGLVWAQATTLLSPLRKSGFRRTGALRQG